MHIWCVIPCITLIHQHSDMDTFCNWMYRKHEKFFCYIWYIGIYKQVRKSRILINNFDEYNKSTFIVSTCLFHVYVIIITFNLRVSSYDKTEFPVLSKNEYEKRNYSDNLFDFAIFAICISLTWKITDLWDLQLLQIKYN